MATIVSWNGSSFTVPATGEENWGGATKVDGLLVSLATNGLQKSGGLFTLSSDLDFGASAGLKAVYYQSRGTVADAGVFRLAKTEALAWRNNADAGNNTLATSTSDQLLYNGTIIVSSAGVVPVAAGGTGIASYTAGDTLYASGATTLSKLAIGTASKVLTSSGTAPAWNFIVNANVDSAAAIAYSKLSLSGSILNADVNASAAIVYSKLSLTGGVVNADVNASAAIAYSKLALTGSVVNADVGASAAIAMSKLAALTASRAVVTDGSGFHTVSATTAAQIAFLAGVADNVHGDSDNATLSNKRISGGLKFTQTSTPATPASGDNWIYPKSDEQFYILNSAGTETKLLTSASAVAVSAVKTANYAILGSDDTVLGDSSGGTFNLTLPTAVGITGKIYRLKKVDSSFTTITVLTTSSQTIDGVVGSTLDTQYESIAVQSDGSNWQLLSRTYPSVWTAYTPTLTGFGTVSTLNCAWKRVGDSIMIQGLFTSGISTATLAAITLPGALTSKVTSALGPLVVGLGTYSVTSASSVNNGVVVTLIATDASNTLGWGVQGISNSGLTAVNANSVLSVGQATAFNAVVQITGWKG